MKKTDIKPILLSVVALTIISGCGGDGSTGSKNPNTHGLLNSRPKAISQAPITREDTQSQITLVGTDEDNDTLGYKVTIQPQHGTIEGMIPNLIYIPNKDYNGEDSFKFVVNDGSEDSSEATVKLTITPVNDSPIATSDKAVIDEDNNVTIDILSNDTDVDKGDILSIKSVQTPKHGNTSIDGSKIVYIPNPNYNGKEAISYTIEDKQGASATATIDLTINPINDAPIAKNDAIDTPIETSVIIDVLKNDEDIEADRLFLKEISKSNNASVEIKNNQIHYTPNKGYLGDEKLTYTVQDKQGATSTATIDIVVRELNDAEKYTKLEDSGVVPKLDRSDTLAGTDSDNNGIRDDVDEYIDKTYTKVNEKKAARQMARAYQLELTSNTQSTEGAKEIFRQIFRAIHCIHSQEIYNYSELKAITLNTKKRTMEHYRFNSLLNGTVTTTPKGDTCEK